MYEYRATCLRVIDGDTYEMDVDLGFHVHVIEKIRLLGLDTPETYGRKAGTPEYEHGKEAKARVETLLFEEVPAGGISADTGDLVTFSEPIEVMLKTQKDKTGKYGRFLADVILPDGRSLSDVLREEGFEKRESYDE